MDANTTKLEEIRQRAEAVGLSPEPWEAILGSWTVYSNYNTDDQAIVAHVRAGIPAQLGERWLRNMMLNKWLDYCLERGHEFTPAAQVAANAPAERLRRLLHRLAGREPNIEDERLFELFRNRVELKKELTALDDERHRLLDRLKLQEGATMRVEEQMASLEQYLGRFDEGYKSLAYYQLKALWRVACKRLEQFGAELARQQKDRERRSSWPSSIARNASAWPW